MNLGSAFYDPASRTLSDSEGNVVSLRPQSLEVLAFLASRPGQVISREEIFESVWPDIAVTDDSLTQCIADIRRAIGDIDRTILRTLPRKGYLLQAEDESTQTSMPSASKPTSKGRVGLWLGAVAAVVGFVVILGDFAIESTQVEQTPLQTPSIVVLPFKDLSASGDMAHFADAMTEDLIVELTRWQEFNVVDRVSSLQFKDSAEDVRAISATVDANYVVEGGIRRIDDTVRITAQLVDGTTGKNVWAERYDETGPNILRLQDGVVARIEQSLIGNHGEVRAQEYRKAWRKSNVSLDEYDYYLRGHDKFYQYRPETTREAIAIWEEGLAKFPNSSVLKVKLGWGFQLCIILNCGDPRATRERILSLVQDGMSDADIATPGHRFGLWLLNTIHSLDGNKARVVAINKELASTYPSDSEGMMLSVDDLVRVDAIDLAEEFVNEVRTRSWNRNPRATTNAGAVDYMRGDCVKALPQLPAQQTDVEGHLMEAGCLAELGRPAEAQAKLEFVEDRYGVRSLDDMAPWVKTNATFRAHIEPQLAKVGWPFTPATQPSIAVMPFVDLSGDPRWQRLGEGLALEISNELARNHWLDVRAPGSALQFADLKGLAAADQLDVIMLMDGTLQSDGETLRVAARLVNADTRAVIWSEKWSGPLDDLFDIQDRILNRIGGSLSGHFSSEIRKRHLLGMARTPTRSVSAFEHQLLAEQAKHRFDADGYAECIRHTEKAIEIDPKYALAWVLKSLCEVWIAPFADSAEETAAYFERAKDSAASAFRSDPDEPAVLLALADPLRSRDNAAAQSAHARRAVELAPSNADVLATGAWVSIYAGVSGATALGWAERALMLNPNPPAWYHIAHGIAAYQAREDELAVQAFLKAPKMTETLLFHASAEMRLGNVENARGLIDELLEMAPGTTLVDYMGEEALTRPDMQDLLEMSAKFGLASAPN